MNECRYRYGITVITPKVSLAPFKMKIKLAPTIALIATTCMCVCVRACCMSCACRVSVMTTMTQTRSCTFLRAPSRWCRTMKLSSHRDVSSHPLPSSRPALLPWQALLPSEATSPPRRVPPANRLSSALLSEAVPTILEHSRYFNRRLSKCVLAHQEALVAQRDVRFAIDSRIV